MDEAQAAMGSVMDGEATPAQLAAFLVALRMRGETTGTSWPASRGDARAGPAGGRARGAIDTCGTGGDGSGTFNISTAAALVVAAAGVPVAKHGNRAMTSRSGSADVLEALGVRTDHDAVAAAAALREDGFAFLFAPALPPGHAHRRPDPPRDRRADGVQPARSAHEPRRRAPAGRWCRRCRGRAQGRRGAPGARHGARLRGPRRRARRTAARRHGRHLRRHPRRRRRLGGRCRPRRLGLRAAARSDLAGGTPDENAALIEAILGGATGPRRDVVLLNAAAALRGRRPAPDLAAGVRLAAATIDSGAAAQLRAGSGRQASAAEPPARRDDRISGPEARA